LKKNKEHDMIWKDVLYWF